MGRLDSIDIRLCVAGVGAGSRAVLMATSPRSMASISSGSACSVTRYALRVTLGAAPAALGNARKPYGSVCARGMGSTRSGWDHGIEVVEEFAGHRDVGGSHAPQLLAPLVDPSRHPSLARCLGSKLGELGPGQCLACAIEVPRGLAPALLGARAGGQPTVKLAAAVGQGCALAGCPAARPCAATWAGAPSSCHAQRLGYAPTS